MTVSLPVIHTILFWRQIFASFYSISSQQVLNKNNYKYDNNDDNYIYNNNDMEVSCKRTPNL